MKKFMAVFAVALFALAAPLTPRARADSAPLQAFDGIARQCALLVEDAAYVLDRDGLLWRWSYDDTEPAVYVHLPTVPNASGSAPYAELPEADRAALEDSVQLLGPGPSGQLYALNVHAGRIGLVTPQGLTWTDTVFDPSPLFSAEGWPLPLLSAPMLAAEGSLVICVQCWDRMDSVHDYYAQILLVDPSTGHTRLLDAPDTAAACMYQEKLLLLCSTLDEAMVQHNSLALLDTESGAITPLSAQLPDGSAGGLAWDGRETVALAVDMGVYLLEEGQGNAHLAANTPGLFAYEGSYGKLLPDGRYAYLDEALTLLSLRKDGQQTLTLQWSAADPQLLSAFQSTHPEALIQVRAENLSCAQVAQRIRSGDSNTDVFCVTVDAGFGELVDKGFAAPLDDEPRIAQSVSDMYAPLRQALLDASGYVVAYPVSLNVSLWSVNQELWDRYFGSAALPTTWEELLTAMLDFEAMDNQEGDLFLNTWDYEDMVQRILWAFLQQADGNTADLQDPALARCLDLLAQAREALGVDYFSSETMYPESEQGGVEHALLGIGQASYDTHLSSLDISARNALLPLTFHGESPCLPATLQVLVVNPLSPRQALAKAFVASAAAPENGLLRYYMLHASATEPVYRTSALTGETYAVISPEGLTAWRQAVPFLRFYERSPLVRDDVQTVLQDCAELYAHGRLDLQGLLAEAERKIAMVQLESR